MFQRPDPLATAKLIDRICDLFERTWETGAEYTLENYLAEVPDHCRSDLFRELLALEVQLRQARGEESSQQDYLRRYPGYAELVSAAFDLADEVQPDKGSSDPGPTSRFLIPGSICGSVEAGFRDCEVQFEGRERFGRFALLDRLGSGGFGTVWKAHDTVLKRPVALKIPKNGQFCPEEAATLLREARAAAGLKHPAIVQVYDVGIERGTAYIASEYIAGRSLRDVLSEGGLSCRRAAEIALLVAEGLDHAHEMGVVHRDLKPGNVLLDGAGNAYVADFGLAKMEDLHSAATGHRVGTVGYMPPEQASGQEPVDRRADIYSLGVILFEMLTGQRPFESRLPGLLAEIEQSVPPSPRRLNQEVPRDLGCICLKCLEKAPADRYPTAAALADDLRAFLRGDPVAARPLSAPVRLWRWCHGRPVLATLALTSLVLSVAIIAVSVASSLRSARLVEMAESELYGHQIARARQSWLANNIHELHEILEACPPHLRGWEWGYLQGLPRSAVHILQGAGGPVAYSPDSSLIATGGGGTKTVRLWDAADGAFAFGLHGHEGYVSDVAFHPDGKLLASAGGSDKTIVLWDLEHRRRQQTFRGHSGHVVDLEFTPDGRRIASAGFDNTVRVWDTASGEEILQIRCPGRRVWALAISPDGDRIATACGRFEAAAIQVWDAHSGREITTLARPGTQADVAFSPDGTKLAVASNGKAVRVWDTSTWRMTLVIAADTGPHARIAFSPDGLRLVSKQSSNVVQLWDASTGDDLLTIRGHTGGVEDFAFSPDGTQLAFGTSDDRVKVYATTDDPECLVLKSNSEVLDVDFSPDGRHLVAGLADGSVSLWDLQSGREPIVLGRHAGEVRSVSFSSGGRRVLSGSQDATAIVWDLDSREPLLTLGKYPEPVWSVAASPDDRWIAVGCQRGGLEVADSRTGEVLHSWSDASRVILSVEFSPDGSSLTGLSRDGIVRIWRLDTGKLASEFELGWSACSSALSPDGRELAAITANGALSLFDLASGALLYRSAATMKHGQADLAYSPDGTRLAVVTQGEAVRIWEPRRHRPLLTIRQGIDVAGIIAFSPDQARIATVFSGGTIRIFRSAGLQQSDGG